MSDALDDRVFEYLAGGDPRRLREALDADPARVAELILQESLIRDLADTEAWTPRRIVFPRRTRRPSSSAWVWGTAAVLLLAVAVGLIATVGTRGPHLPPPVAKDSKVPLPPPVPTPPLAIAAFESVTGQVTVNGAPAATGRAFAGGEAIETRAGQAVLKLSDGTRIDIPPATTISRISEKRVHLDRGALTARAAAPITFVTPHGEARVLGTTLRLLVDRATRLEVTEGKVRLNELEVPAGHYASTSDPSARPLAGPAILSFTLMDADADRPIPEFDPIPEGAVLVLDQLPTRRLNIRANTYPARIGCVQFGFDGNEYFNTEREAPYSFATGGGSVGDFSAWTPSAGTHTLIATPWTGGPAPRKRGGTGSKGAPLTLSFTIR